MYTLILSQEQLGIIGRALDQVAYGIAAPIINNINTQIQQQVSESKEV